MINVQTFSVTSVQGLRHKLDQEQLGFTPTLAIAFGDPHFDLKHAISIFNERDIDLIGCSSAGEICDDRVLKGNLSVMLLNLANQAYKTVHISGVGSNYHAEGMALAKIAKNAFKNPAILLYIGGMGVDGDTVIAGIKTILGNEAPLFGGMAADNFLFEKIQTFDANGVYENGISALVLDSDQVHLEGQSYSGWQELGMNHIITRCDGNLLYEVDHKPALDLFNRYFRELKYRQVEGSSDLFTVPGVFALSIQRQDGTNFMRSTLMFDFDARALVLAGGIQEGDSFRFCPTPSFEVIEDTLDVFRANHKPKSNVAGVIMNSCAARLVAFGPLLEDEIRGIRRILDAPMVGFMAYGEIGKRKYDFEYGFHNVTCSLVKIGEVADQELKPWTSSTN